MQVNRVGLLLADVPDLVDESGVSAEAFASLRLFRCASSAEFIGLFESAVDVVRVQNGQIESGRCAMDDQHDQEETRQLARHLDETRMDQIKVST